jgi:hypothetical protein
MGRLLHVVLFTLVVASALAQNLVPNPSFEEHKELPCDLNDGKIQDFVVEWMQPLGTTTDYYNSASASSCQLNPMNLNRSARSGTGMGGLIGSHIFNNFKTTYAEYLEVKLTEPLVPDQAYYVEFYALNRNLVIHSSDILESNNLGLAFSETLLLDFSNSQPDHLFLKPQVKETDIIKADDQWKKISGCFIADKAYEYLIIGTFDTPEATVTNRLTHQFSNAYAYYFIDDVTLYQMPTSPGAFATTETMFCFDSDQVDLSAEVPGANFYKWETGDTTAAITISDRLSKTVQVKIGFPQCELDRSFNITYVPDIDLGSDTVLCHGQYLTLEPFHQFAFYWNDMSQDQKKEITSSGSHWIRSATGCNSSDTISVEFTDCPGNVPNVITPNADNLNEFLIVENIELAQWSLRIINRWGQQVFYAPVYSNTWNANDLSDGVYFYYLFSAQLNRSVKGWVEVSRR